MTDSLTESLTEVKCRATSVAKNQSMLIKTFIITISRLLLVEMVKCFRYQTIPAPLHFLELPKHVLSWYISEIQFGAKLAIGPPRLPLVGTRQSWLPIGRSTAGSSLLLSCHETLGSLILTPPALRQIWNCLKALIWYLKLISDQSFQH